jgi:very-short-patch-repair endonuclease
LNDELEERAQVSIAELQKEIDRLVIELHRLTAELIEASSWAYQIGRTGLAQKQALNGWVQTMRRIGKGTGRRVPQLLAEARKQMEKCRSAVPVWIMPLARVVENYHPQKGLFDVVIIDEASQCDVTGLIALYLGKKIIVVGDHEQVSPEAVGKKIEDAQSLIEEYLQGIPNPHLYGGKLSIYDLAMQSFRGTICLREHFRCVPEIIQFSNGLSYDWKIKPLRDSTHSPLAPAVIAYRVRNGSSDSKVNKVEATAVAALIAAAVEQPEYAEQTFGVISLVGDEQAEEIEKILRSKLLPAEFTKRQIICGNAAQFQGDERDLMFLSVVDGPDENGPLRMRQDDLFKKRFNVAASRACNQLWVVHSLHPAVDLKPGDLRRRLIEYAQNPIARLQAQAQQLNRAESEFERQVMRRLIDARFRVTSQWPVGAYRIDMVVSGNDQRLAVECDGDRWHPLEKIPEDMERQAILERLGWKFIRIRGSEFFRNPDKAMELVFTRLASLGIEPEGATQLPEQERTELAERVI